MRIIRALCVALAVSPLLINSLAQAEPNHWGHGDIHRFHERDLEIWRGGSWRHEVHDGRLGWWWLVGGIWYFYAQPVYPYPDPYVPSDVIVQPVAPAAVAPSYHYYCQNPVGYYPYVARCFAPWQRVEAGMPPPADAVPMPPKGVPPPGY